LTKASTPRIPERSSRLSSAVRRRTANLLIYMLAGLSLASLGAWGSFLASGQSFNQQRLLIEHRHRDGMHEYRTLGHITRNMAATTAFVRPEQPAHISARRLSRATDPVLQHAELASITNAWIELEAPVPPESMSIHGIITHGCGWPFTMYRSVIVRHVSLRPRSFVYTRDMWKEPLPIGVRITRSMPAHTVTSGQSSPQGFWVPTDWLDLQWGGLATDRIPAFVRNAIPSSHKFPTQIPLTPIWPGLLANTAIYATLIWLILAALATLRRRIHRWRHPNANPCKHCHYDLTGITQPICPECGHAIPSPQSNPKSERQPPPQTDQ